MSWVDTQQENLIEYLNSALRKLGQEGNVRLPLRTNIDMVFNRLTEIYQELLPEDIYTPKRIDNEIDNETNGMILRLEQGVLDKEYETTEDELIVANDLRQLIGHYSPAQLRDVLNQYVYGRASDICRTRYNNKLASYQQTLAKSLERLQAVEPTMWFSVDFLTSYIMLTKEERKAKQNIIWTVTPTMILTGDIVKTGEDFRRYKLEEISDSGGGILALPGSLTYVDRVRAVGPWFQPTINRLVKEGEGTGLVVLRTLQRDEPLATFMVRNPEHTSRLLQNSGKVAREVKNLFEIMTTAVRGVEADLKKPIRPNKVIELLPDPIVLEMGVRVREDGSIDYGDAIRTLEQRKLDLQQALTELALETAPLIDEKGNPPDDMAEKLNQIKSMVADTEHDIQRLTRKNTLEDKGD